MTEEHCVKGRKPTVQNRNFVLRLSNLQFRLLAFAITLLIAATIPLLAQVPKQAQLKNFSQLIYRTTPQGKIPQALITGIDAHPVGNGEIMVTNFALKKFRDTEGKEIQFTAQAPECRLDSSAHIAHDAGPLQIFSPTTNFFIQGKGFFCTQSNSLLVISNDVETSVLKSLMKSPALATSAAANPNDVLKIFSDHFQYRFDSNVITYTGNVRALDSQMEIHCQWLTAQFTTNGVIENLFAEHNVEINTTNQGHATSDSATYVVNEGREEIQLHGNAHWHDIGADLTAETLHFDRNDQTVLAQHNAHLQLPRSSIMNMPLSANQTSAIPSNAIVDVSAESLLSLLISPTRTSRQLLALTNVVILSAADHNRATADRAEFNQADGKVSLQGNATFETEQFAARAETLLLDHTNALLKAQHNASLKILSSTKTTNIQPAEIVCDNFELTTNHAAFHSTGTSGNFVTMDFTEHSMSNQLRCAELKFALVSNEVETAIASGDVQFEQANSLRLGSKLLTLERSPTTSLLKHLRAEDNVVLEEISHDANKKSSAKIFAGLLDAHFAPNTNSIEEMVIERNVRLESAELRASGQRAFYKLNGARENFEITGQPVATLSKMYKSGQVKSFQLTAPEKITWEGPAGTLFRSPTNGVTRAPGGRIIPLN